MTDFGCSELISSFRSVPQGGRNSPAIFSLGGIDDAVIDINLNTNCKAKGFYDDLTLICPADKNAVKRAINRLVESLKRVGLSISLKKLEWTRFGIRNFGNPNLKVFGKKL
jgi:hypothetical protein